MASLAKTFYDQITGADFLKGLIELTQPKSEEEWLEFKRAPDNDPEQVKKTWSEVLSAFANTGGGVVVWGIDARKNSSGVDCANALVEVLNPALLESRLREIQRQATDPPVTGVEYKHFVGTTAPDRGFVVCHVPESAHRPHRAEFVTNKPNMMRAGANSVVMAQSVLRAMFHPNTSPRFEIQAGVQEIDMDYVIIHITLINSGMATARDLIVYFESGNQIIDWNYEKETWLFQVKKQSGECREPVHPGFESLIFRPKIKIIRAWVGGLDIGMKFTIYAHDSQRVEIPVVFDEHDLRARRWKKFYPVEASD